MSVYALFWGLTGVAWMQVVQGYYRLKRLRQMLDMTKQLNVELEKLAEEVRMQMMNRSSRDDK